jgi:acetyl esterase/lipase
MDQGAASSRTMRERLDPEMHEGIEGYVLPAAGSQGLETVRATPLRDVVLSEAVERTEFTVPGTPAVPVRIHRPVGRPGKLPAIVTIHGGGLVFGSYDMDSPLLDRWCSAFGVVGVSVAYRLAPENPYPAALEDCYGALGWAYRHSEDLGIDRAKIGLFGISAGGGLAAALALLARDRAEVPLAFQILDTPMLDDRQMTESIQAEDLYIWTKEWNLFGWKSYLGSLHGSHDVPPYAAPARAEDLTGLPPAIVTVGSIDGFRDEDVDYAVGLNRAGVPCELHVFDGLPHGYGLVPGASGVKMAVANMESWLMRRLARLEGPRGA